MKKLAILIAFLSVASVTKAQGDYEPKMVILAPFATTIEPSLKAETDKQTEELKSSPMATGQLPADGGKPGNIKLMTKSTLSFFKQVNFSKTISLTAQDYLIYKFYEHFENCLILLGSETSGGELADLQKIAVKENTTYVLNFPKVSFYKENKQTVCKIQVQLYDVQSNQILFNNEYTGGWNNPGFEFACETGTIGCTINNALAPAFQEVIRGVASTNKTIVRARELAEQRAAYIEKSVYPKTFDALLVKDVVKDSTVNFNNLYQNFYSPDRAKFVAFFITTLDKKDAKPLLAAKSDNNVKIITSKNIKDPGYLDQRPQTYAYVVTGINYLGKWYYKKSEATYFDAGTAKAGKLEFLNNLQGWDYFADNSAEPSDGFWDGELFRKVQDKRKDTDWEKYKKMWADEEKENREYVGQYELIADELKAGKREAEKKFRQRLVNLILPHYESMVKSKSNHFAKLGANYQFLNLIYPASDDVVLNPFKVVDEKGVARIRFFVLIPKYNQLYEWTLPKPYVLKKGEYTDEPITNIIKAFTAWSFADETLEDAAFWKERILLKDGGSYKYLKLIR
ncbi:hypothetical protein [Mucilaginibacter gilvus]|uniref:Uncharacterized protein n=1 Tax=Mucilaginibacter gilvus TaxID=2305909 RepID=A0A444MKS0_9SPHI|nr:hypothetical protein [Mucilaginibacter gilvus]RWY49459.1 hypothetical protein EPL05_18830 [Mucilaginibacter gilvus]